MEICIENMGIRVIPMIENTKNCFRDLLTFKGGEVRTGSPSFFEGGNGVEATSSEKVDWHTKFSREFVKNVEFLQNSPGKICKNLQK